MEIPQESRDAAPYAVAEYVLRSRDFCTKFSSVQCPLAQAASAGAAGAK